MIFPATETRRSGTGFGLKGHELRESAEEHTAVPRRTRCCRRLTPEIAANRGYFPQKLPSELLDSLTRTVFFGAHRSDNIQRRPDAAAKLVQGCGKAAIGRAALAAPWP